MSATSILVNVGAATSGAVRNLKDVSDELKKVDDSAKKSGGSWKSFGKIATAGVAGVGIAVGAAAAAMVDFAKAAIDDNKEAEKLAGTLEKIPGVTQKMIDKNAEWIDGMELATGISDTKLRDSVGKLAVTTGDLAKAQDLASLAADVAVGRNMSLESVTKLLEKAYSGNTTALKKQMPWLDANKDGTLTYAEAVEGLTGKYKGAAEAASNRDPWEKLKTIWGQLKEQLGQWVIPLIEKFGDWFKKKENQQKIQEFLEKVGELSRNLGEKLVKALEDAYKYLQSKEGKKAIEDLKDLMKDLASATKTVAGWFDTLNGWKWVFDLNPIVGLARAWERVKAAIEWVSDHNPFGGGGRSSGGGSFRSLSTSGRSLMSDGGTSRRSVGNVVINLYGDPVANERAVKRALEGYDVSMGRKPGQKLARAW
jgi:polyhydroxyalkanoate synthesis regulator phasin